RKKETGGPQQTLAEAQSVAQLGRADWSRAAEIQHSVLPRLEKERAELEARAVQQKDGAPMVPNEVDEEDIAATVAKWTGIPVTRLLEGETQKLLQMEQRLAQRVVGQDEAIRAVANAVRRARSGLSDPNRPTGSFLFLEPTGVGKPVTANLGAHIFRDYEQPDKVRPLIMQELRTTLRPEFLNRIDEVVIFRPLGRQDLDRIVDIQLGHLRKRLSDRRIGLDVTSAAKA